VFGIQPKSFRIDGVGVRKIHHGVAAIDAFEREHVDQFLPVEALAVVLGRPAQQAQEIDESLGEKAVISIGGDADDGPWRRLESLAPSGAISSGRWANWEGPRESLEDQHVLKVLVR